jgi:acyl dehydratase
MAHFQTLAQLLSLVGQEVAMTPWTLITQEQINQFAEATGDFQWIHVDVARAKAGPFGTPIAHGFLTLSLIPKFFDESVVVDEPSIGVNYGLNKVRFMAPVPVGSRLRARLKLLVTQPVAGPAGSSGVQMTWEVTIEREGAHKPVCVAQCLVRRYPQALDDAPYDAEAVAPRHPL